MSDPEPSQQSPERTPVPAPSRRLALTLETMRGDLFSVLASAERAAEEIRRRAELEAGERIDEISRYGDRLAATRAGEIAELTDDLVEQAGTVRRHSDDLIRTLGEQTERVEAAYAEMIESLAAVSSRLAERAGERPTEVTLAQRREVSFRVPRRASEKGSP